MLSDSKILIVDDTPANLEVLNEILMAQGYTVSIAVSGERAIKQLNNYLPDLILLDVQMPGIDGFETCRRIKANPHWTAIPVIFITALNDAENIAKGFSLGAVDYVSKPFQESELLARVRTHLHLQQMTQHLEHLVAERTQALEMAMTQLQASQLKTIQNEKMVTLGNLVAGIAHEVNNPLGFLNGSIQNVREYLQALFEHLETYQTQHPPNDIVQESAEAIDLNFLMEDLPKLLASMQGATDRITNISTSLRTFSRADTEHQVKANIHEGIDSTLMLLKYRLKASELRPSIEVIKNYGDLPDIYCFPGQLNQVFMNILANAIDMFDEMAEHTTYDDLKDNPQHITITTQHLAEQNCVEIGVRDNGKGMGDEVKAKIFDCLFTTKRVGKGTGLGLAIAHKIITKAHGGHINVISHPGQGPEFLIQIPIS